MGGGEGAREREDVLVLGGETAASGTSRIDFFEGAKVGREKGAQFFRGRIREFCFLQGNELWASRGDISEHVTAF